MIMQSVFVQRLRNASRRELHVEWAALLDKLTIAGHSHQTVAELYTEITDHMPLLKKVSHNLICLTYVTSEYLYHKCLCPYC